MMCRVSDELYDWVRTFRSELGYKGAGQALGLCAATVKMICIGSPVQSVTVSKLERAVRNPENVALRAEFEERFRKRREWDSVNRLQS